jgi:nickel-dependent lactate racemase
MNIKVPYGTSFLPITLPDGLPVDIIESPKISPAFNPLQVVQDALDNPIGSVDLSDFSGVKSVGIAISDKTRPVPHQHLLPPLLERLESLGIPSQAIKLFIAVGTHVPMPPAEFPSILTEAIIERYPVISHDASDDTNLVHLGNTSRGTPVWVNKEFYNSDSKIVVGNIEPHYFAGFSGGVKSAAIGLAGTETITHNHALLTHPDSKLGNYETNPTRQDIEEIGQKMGVHFVLNAVLNQSKQIVHGLCGEPREVMVAGIPLSREVCQVGVHDKYSLIIASSGGHPKDINLYQSQKGLDNAALVAKPGGIIVLAAACPEGTGSAHYEDWVRGMSSNKEVIDRFTTEKFRIGPHKAFFIARVSLQVRLLFFSEMDVDFSKTLLLDPIKDLQQAIDFLIKELEPGERIGFLPHAASTIPYVLDSPDLGI